MNAVEKGLKGKLNTSLAVYFNCDLLGLALQTGELESHLQ